ncbi:MAG TPA: GlsB/YeaQ/YmgE family stress response membrane protein [Kofleriaceae bacterium]|nr:GlsB/YeaQ/YmgE family stress response membrane protein [Kofleriaceae bacterium]
MGLIVALLVGLVVGAIARFIMPGRDPAGLLITSLLGVSGAVVAWVAGRAIGWYDTSGAGPGFIASILGALCVLAVYRTVSGRT